MKNLGDSASKLASRLLDNYGARPYLDQTYYLQKENGKWIPSGWSMEQEGSAESAVRYIIFEYYFDGLDEKYKEQLGFKNSPTDEAKLFVMLAFIVLVPFGRLGYTFLEQEIKNRFPDKSIGEFLFEKLLERINCPLNKSAFLGLNDEQLNYIKEFFMDFQKEEINLALPRDVASFISRLYFEIAGLHKQEIDGHTYYYHYLRSDYIEPKINQIDSLIAENDGGIITIKASEYFKDIPVRMSLTKAEENFILKKFNLNSKKGKKS